MVQDTKHTSNKTRLVKLTVNGVTYERLVEPRLTLVDFIRGELGITGTHVGCDTSQCGACVVHLNENSVKSCTTLVADCHGSEITTIEGLAKKFT